MKKNKINCSCSLSYRAELGFKCQREEMSPQQRFTTLKLWQEEVGFPTD